MNFGQQKLDKATFTQSLYCPGVKGNDFGLPTAPFFLNHSFDKPGIICH